MFVIKDQDQDHKFTNNENAPWIIKSLFDTAIIFYDSLSLIHDWTSKKSRENSRNFPAVNEISNLDGKIDEWLNQQDDCKESTVSNEGFFKALKSCNSIRGGGIFLSCFWGSSWCQGLRLRLVRGLATFLSNICLETSLYYTGWMGIGRIQNIFVNSLKVLFRYSKVEQCFIVLQLFFFLLLLLCLLSLLRRFISR